MAETDLHRTTLMLRRARDGDPTAAAELLPLVYEELRGLAARYMQRERSGHTLQATALVHEAYLRLVSVDDVEWEDRGHFIAIASKSMRRILVEHARRLQTAKRGGGRVRVAMSDSGAVDGGAARAHGVSGHGDGIDILDLEDVLEKLESLDERKARLVELRLFGGMGVAEAASALGVAPKTAEGDWYMARAWLRDELADV